MKKNKDPTAAATKQSGPDNHDLNHHCADEANSMLHMKAEIHRLRAEVARLKHLQLKEPTSRPKSKNSRERRSYSLSSRPARTKQKDHEVVGDLELCSSITTTTTTKDRHPSANGLHHRRHPHEFVSLLKNSNSSPENSLLSKHSESNVEDQLESQQQMQPEDEITCADVSFTSVVIDRAGWLVGLLVLQSLSSFIIQRNEILLQDHVVIIRFLTMLIGAGGNAGNQATVKVIRGLAVGTIRFDSFLDFWKEELKVGLAISGILALAGCLRVAVFALPWKETMAITCSLFSIVWISTVLGSLLPMGLTLMRIDPAHSSTTIQVIMDILGVTITVSICSALL